MIKNGKIQKLAYSLINNIRGLTKVSDMELPLVEDNLKIEHIDNKVIFTLNNKKISYFYTEDGYAPNLQLLKRIMFKEGIELANESALAVRTFKKEIFMFLKENE